MENLSPAKRVLLGLLIVILSVCLVADGLYIVLKFCFPEKLVSMTFNVNELEVVNEDGSVGNLGNIIEVNYYANEDNSGVELFELKLNTLKNETSTNTFSSGIQLVGSSDKIEAIGNSGIYKDKGFLGMAGTDYWYKLHFNCDEYYYNTDGNNISFVASLAIKDDDYFLITIGQEKYRMSLKKFTTIKLADDRPVLWATNSYYAYGDWNYLTYILGNSVRSLPYGYDGTLTLKFGDLFDYYAYDEENQTYSKETTMTGDGSLITEIIDNYYTIKVNTYYSGAQTANDSLFGMIEEDYTFNLTGSSLVSDYSLDRQIIDLDQYDFDYIRSEEATWKYNLKLKDNIKQYLSGRSRYVLRITIDSSVLSDYGIVYNSLVYDDFLTENIVCEVVVL